MLKCPCVLRNKVPNARYEVRIVGCKGSSSDQTVGGLWVRHLRCRVVFSEAVLVGLPLFIISPCCFSVGILCEQIHSALVVCGYSKYTGCVSISSLVQ